jgi:hypothetical protein
MKPAGGLVKTGGPVLWEDQKARVRSHATACGVPRSPPAAVSAARRRRSISPATLSSHWQPARRARPASLATVDKHQHRAASRELALMLDLAVSHRPR